MQLDQVKKYLYEKVRINIIQGKITGLSQLPNDNDIEKEIDNILNGSLNGIIGSIEPFVYKDVSNSDKYNQNFLTIKDNIEYLLGNVFDNLNSIIDLVNDSVLEKNQVLRDLKLIDTEFSDIESGTLHNDGLKYVLSDTFIDTDKIDMLRTTAQVNLNAGTVSLNNLTSSYLSFPHYKNQGTINFIITEGASQIKTQTQTPGAYFGNIFNSDNTDRWELAVTTSSPVIVAGYFILKLSEIGEAVNINSINLKLFSTKDVNATPDIITIYYLNNDPSNKVWKILPGGSIDVNGPEISTSFPGITTTHLRFFWTKYYPDDMNNMQYLFSVTELGVQLATTVYESVLITNPLEIGSYQTEKPTIYLAEIEASTSVQPGSNIQFYVGIDEPVAGKIVDASNNIVPIDSDGAVRFIPNGLDASNNLENYCIYASDLRNRPYISGSLPYQNWQPKWQQITPASNNVPGIPQRVFFNISDVSNKIHDLYYTTPVVWGDPSYKGPWPVASYTGTWANGWDGNVSPESGYIFGEDPFTTAGVWWGESVENPGWWRPNTPTASGTLPNIPKTSFPDFSIPVYDSNGNPQFQFDEKRNRRLPIQKQFWKIFKWPSSSLPIPGSIKLSNEFLVNSSSILSNHNIWKWNYKSTIGADDFTISDISLPSNVNFFTIKLDEYITNMSNIGIIPGSIRDVKFLNVSPGTIEDFVVEYGREYILDSNGLWAPIDSDPIVADARATIIFSDNLMAQRRHGTKDPVNITLVVSYQATNNISASWDGYLFVPESAAAQLPVCHITPTDNLQTVSVQQMSENGMVLQSKTIGGGSENVETLGQFSLYQGLNLIRTFVNTQVVQDNRTNESIALWRPDQHNYQFAPDTIYTQGNYVTDATVTPLPGNYIPNAIIDSSNFISLNIETGMKLLITYYYFNNINYNLVTDYTEVIITKVYQNNTGKFEIRFNSPIDVDVYVASWKIEQFTMSPAFTYGSDAQSSTKSQYMTQVDINVLLYETDVNDDSKYSIISDVDDSQYIVVKTPNTIKYPSNYVNTLHYLRTYWDYKTGQYITYTTGTDHNQKANPVTISTIQELVPTSIPNNPPNTLDNVSYPNISTYGAAINTIDSTSLGFLFHDTAENLQTTYAIEYSLPIKNHQANRILLMSKLLSTDNTVSPVLKSYSLIINNSVRGS